MTKQDRALLWGIKFALLVPALVLFVPQLALWTTLWVAGVLAALPVVK